MTTLNFPDSPEINDIYSLSDRSWRWTGVAWESVAGIGPTGPEGPQGDQGIQGEIGETGETGVVDAISPILYDPETRTVSFDESAFDLSELDTQEKLNIMGAY